MGIYRVLICSAFLALLVFSSLSPARSEEDGAEVVAEESFVLTLDASNFTETVSKYQFIVVEFYAPWCGHCKKLAPEYEKAATILSKHDPPAVLAKVDGSDATNVELATEYELRGFPTIKILRDQGTKVYEYNGPKDKAEGIVKYLKRQLGPASVEIKSSEDVSDLIEDKKTFLVAVLPDYSREEFKNFTAVAEKLRYNFDFCHTLDAKILPLGDLTVSGPVVRLFKPFDELFVDFQDFHVEALEDFIETASEPKVITLDGDPINHPFVMKFFNLQNPKVILFLNFSSEYFDSFKSKYNEVAEQYKGNNITFMIADLDSSLRAFQFYGLKDKQVPAIYLQETHGNNYLKPNLEPDQIATWVKDYLDGSLTPFKKSEPIPEVNNEPVKVVVSDTYHDMVYKSGKNVLLEFYIPWCVHCQKLLPILEEVAVSLQNDDDVVIAKMDASANEVPREFDIVGYPTVYFFTPSGKPVEYKEHRTKEEIIDFIQKHRDAIIQDATIQKDTTVESESLKDEL